MKKQRDLRFALFSAFVAVASACALTAAAGAKPAAPVQPASIIPAPVEVVFANGAFTL